MQIDRKRFLSLVGAIGAVAACGGAQHDQPAVIVAMDPIDAGAPAPAATPAPIIAKPVEKPAPEMDGPAKPAGIWLGTYDAKAKVRTCSDLKCPGPTHEGPNYVTTDCKGIEKTLSTETFQRFMGCMMKGTPTCDGSKLGTDAGECLEGWYTTPNIEASTEAKCKPIVAACAKTNRDPNASGTLKTHQCQQMLSVTAPKAEKKMMHCITEYCEGSLTLCKDTMLY